MEQPGFAADVLRNLLRHISIENDKGHEPFLVSHAWTDGPVMYLVYQAPPSDRTWGLVRDTRDSIIDPGPWPGLDEAVLYYYLLDFEENQPSSSFRRPDEDDTIWWFGSPREGLPELLSDIPEKHRCVAHTEPRLVNDDRDQPRATEPRLDGNSM